MECSNNSMSAERVSLERELRQWFTGQGVSQQGAARAVHLLDATTLLAQPRPSRWNRRGKFGVQERCRYLWYRHTAQILGWCDRRRFPDIVTGLVRGHVFPTRPTREDGRVSAAAPAGSRAIDAAHHFAGGSSCRSIGHAFSSQFRGELSVWGSLHWLRFGMRVTLLSYCSL